MILRVLSKCVEEGLIDDPKRKRVVHLKGREPNCQSIG